MRIGRDRAARGRCLLQYRSCKFLNSLGRTTGRGNWEFWRFYGDVNPAGANCPGRGGGVQSGDDDGIGIQRLVAAEGDLFELVVFFERGFGICFHESLLLNCC